MCTIAVPVKPYMVKYLRKKLKLVDNNIILSNCDSIGFGIVISSLLVNKKQYDKITDSKQVDDFFKKFNILSEINIKLNRRQYERCGRFINKEHAYLINEFIDKSFRNEMMTFIFSQKALSPKIVITYALDDFTSMFDITEYDIKKETLLKNYNRHKLNYSYLE